ncbi:class II aldolase/adducin family protein [Streptomyces sp. NPDC056149]|uniref:class II aldolase/adducin family protein n=1 Tax=unclassified Streptomyces TaxID=2593676 RepID=UPI0023813C0A|nr:class II aldolase/adducin family protein [Streptomyces sp. WZ-12]
MSAATTTTAALGASGPTRLVGPAPDGTGLPTPPVFDSLDAERRYRKEQLAAGFRLFGKFGFSEGVAGHITVRDPEHPDCFWVNPFGMSFHRIKVSDLILVDHEGNVLHGERPVNKAAFVIHSQVHAARPDVQAAAHAHSLHGKAFASLGIPLAPLTQDACAFYEDHGLYADYRGVADELEEGRRIGAALGPHKAAILANHGLLTVGHTVAEAVWWFVTMERSCQAQLLAMAAGKPLHIDHETALRTRDQLGTPLAGWFQAQPMWDQITDDAPDLFD